MTPAVQVRVLQTFAKLFQASRAPPAFLRKRRRTSRPQRLLDWTSPVTTAREQAVFLELYQAFTKGSRTDWTGMVNAFNHRAVQSWNKENPDQHMLLKVEGDLQKYEKSLVQQCGASDMRRIASIHPSARVAQTDGRPPPSPAQAAMPGQPLGMPGSPAPQPPAPQPSASAPAVTLGKRSIAELMRQPMPRSATMRPGPALLGSGHRKCRMCNQAGLPSQPSGHNCALEVLKAGKDPSSYGALFAAKISAVQEQCNKRKIPYPPPHDKLHVLSDHFRKRAEADAKRNQNRKG